MWHRSLAELVTTLARGFAAGSSSGQHPRWGCLATRAWPRTVGKKNSWLRREPCIDCSEHHPLSSVLKNRSWALPAAVGSNCLQREHRYLRAARCRDSGKRMSRWVLLRLNPQMLRNAAHCRTPSACRNPDNNAAQPDLFFRKRNTAPCQGNPYWPAASRGCSRGAAIW